MQVSPNMARHERTYWVLAIAVAALFPAGGAFGTEAPKASTRLPDLDLSQPAAAATVERICDTAVSNIARRYNLNEEQTRTTSELMKREVGKFIEEHEELVWPVIRELLAKQLQPPENAAELKRLGKSARELAALAKDAIFRANAEWRQMLSDEQKAVHDFDLAEMEKTFDKMDQTLGGWEKGEHTHDPMFPPPNMAGSPPRPSKPAEGTIPEPKQEFFKVTIFDTFVEEFIKDYNLDAAQKETARSILKEFKAKANDFKSAKSAEFAQIESSRAKAVRDRDYKKAAEADASRKKLLEPVYQLFAEMRDRLKSLLTSTQLELFAAKNKGETSEKSEDTSPKKDEKPQIKKRTSAEVKKSGEKKEPKPAKTTPNP